MGRIYRRSSLWLVLALLARVQTAGGEDALSPETVQRFKQATVYVKTELSELHWSGSGFVIEVSGDTVLIATNHHVIAKPKELQPGGQVSELAPADQAALRKLQHDLAGKEPKVSVVFNSGDADEHVREAEVVGDLDEPDLAILKVSGVKQPPPAIDFRKKPQIVETMVVYLLGFPFGEALARDAGHPTITIGKGQVSSIRKNAAGLVSRVQIDGSLNPGNSGGPVVDAKGNLVGVAVEAIRGSNIGLAIPTHELAACFEGRVGKPMASFAASADRAPPALDVVVPVMDPQRKVKSATLDYVAESVKADPTKAGKAQLQKAAGARQVELTIAGAAGRATFPVAAGKGTQARDFTFQVSFVDAQGRTTHLDPQVVKVAPAVAPTTTVPGGPSFVFRRRVIGAGRNRRVVTELVPVDPSQVPVKPPGDSVARVPANPDSKADSPFSTEKEPGADAAKPGAADADHEDAPLAGKNENRNGKDQRAKTVWVNRIVRMKKIPDGEVSGKLDGLDFDLESAVLDNSLLRLRKGKEFFADLEIEIHLGLKRNEDVSGRKIVIDGQAQAGKSRVVVKTKRPRDKLPRGDEFKDFLMVLEFGEYNATERVQPGKIYICLPDRAKSYLAGSFNADVK